MSIPDRFQYFFDDSGNFQNFVKIWTRNPPNYCQFTSKNTRKNMGTSLENMDFGNLRIWKSQNFRKSCVPNLKIFFCEPSFFILEYDNIMKSWKVEDEESPDINFH